MEQVVSIRAVQDRAWAAALEAALAGSDKHTVALDCFISENLIRHFSAYEVAPIGRTHGSAVLSPPPLNLWENIIPTLHVAEWARSELGCGLKVTSGWRDEAYNAAVGGASGSIHKLFNALDLVPLGRTTKDLHDCLSSFPQADLLGLGYYPVQGFVHLDTRAYIGAGPRARWAG